MEDNTLEDLLNATFFALRKEGRFEEAKLVEQMMKKEHKNNAECFTSEEALATLLDCRLSKEDYQTLRSGAKEKGSS